MFEGKTIIVSVDSDGDVYLYIVADHEIEKYYEENPKGDHFALCQTYGRELTAEEQGALPNIEGALAY